MSSIPRGSRSPEGSRGAAAAGQQGSSRGAAGQQQRSKTTAGGCGSFLHAPLSPSLNFTLRSRTPSSRVWMYRTWLPFATGHVFSPFPARDPPSYLRHVQGSAIRQGGSPPFSLHITSDRVIVPTQQLPPPPGRAPQPDPPHTPHAPSQHASPSTTPPAATQSASGAEV